jgi:putative spermidine/putrescine transport system ATP-binding protein
MTLQGRAAELGAIGIAKSYGPFEALKDISLEIGRGEFVTLLGPSGSGKTTFLMILAGFEEATSGRLLLNGSDITGQSPEERAFGMVFQGYALFPHMTVAQNIAFPLSVRGVGRADMRRRVGEMIERVGLVGHADKKPAKLSGGQQQRVALARALVFEPQVLLLDEPFSALDKNLREAMQGEVKRLHRDFGTTFVFVTHDQSEALALSTKLAIFERGRLLQTGTPREIYERPVHRFTAEFLGEINLVPVSSISVDGNLVTGLFEGRRIAAPRDGRSGEARTSERATTIGVRPEYVRLDPPGTPIAANDNALDVQVTDLTYLGPITQLSLRTTSGLELGARLPTSSPHAASTPGTPLQFVWTIADGFVLPEAAT